MGSGSLGHEWDQPGEHGPVRSNGQPGPFARGRPSGGTHAAGVAAATGRARAREGVPPGQRKASNPRPSGFEVFASEKAKKLGQRGESRERPGAMEAGRYDLSLTANRRFQGWCESWAREALRVLKPGGHMLVCGGTRTYHRMAAGVEDAGFEVRDCLMWLYGGGFPKSLNVGCRCEGRRSVRGTDLDQSRSQAGGAWPLCERCGKPAAGIGTALKPSWEPIVVARKPFGGTVAGNVLAHGTAALNIDGCRIATAESLNGGAYSEERQPFTGREYEQPSGRWPANVLLAHDEDCVLVGAERVRADGHFPAARGASGYGSAVPESNGGGLKGQEDLEERHFDGELVERWACVPGCPVRMLDAQSGVSRDGVASARSRGFASDGYVGGAGSDYNGEPLGYGSEGGASRFFYCAKASRAEREAGLAGFGEREVLWSNGTENPGSFQSDGTKRSARNHHPTVKPIDLMRWLVRLVTPPGGLVVDCFVGSGTTGCAAVLEGFEFVGIERQEDYVAIARARVGFWHEHPTGLPVDVALQAETRHRRARDAGQLGLLDS